MPLWLQALKQKRSKCQGSQGTSPPSAELAQNSGLQFQRRLPLTRTRSFTLHRLSGDESPHSNVQPHSSRHVYRSSAHDNEELQRIGRFKGWVKSLVERFSGSTKEK